MATNAQRISPDRSTAQSTLRLGPTGLVHRGGGTPPWSKQLVLTRAPSPAAHHIFLMLGSFVADSATDAWPSIAWLADKSGRSARVVQRCIRELREAGLVAVQLSNGGTSRYRLSPSTPTTPASPPHDAGVTPPHDAGVTPPTTRASPEVRTNEVLKRREAAQQPVSKIGHGQRHECAFCGNTWPGSYAPVCFKCGRKVGESHPAGQAAPEPGKYDALF